MFDKIILASCAILVSGCNALYYYDKANVALSIEARPDPTAPAQVSIGYKQRTVVVSPKMKDGETQKKDENQSGTPNPSFAKLGDNVAGVAVKNTAGNDALAMIGSFSASHSGFKQDGTTAKMGKTVIRSAFLSGDAANYQAASTLPPAGTAPASPPAVAAPAAGEARAATEARAAAVALAGPGPSPAEVYISNASEKKLCPQLRTIAAPGRPFAPYSQFTPSERSVLTQIKYFPPDHSKELYESLQQEIGKCR